MSPALLSALEVASVAALVVAVFRLSRQSRLIAHIRFALAGLGLLGKRVASKVLRGLSSPDDYVANLLTSVFASLAAVAAFVPDARAAWLVAGAALLLYVPVGKIRHCLLFFPARYEMGRFFGRRGTFPPASRRAA